jgi:hypothetical protein
MSVTSSGSPESSGRSTTSSVRPSLRAIDIDSGAREATTTGCACAAVNPPRQHNKADIDHPSPAGDDLELILWCAQGVHRRFGRGRHQADAVIWRNALTSGNSIQQHQKDAKVQRCGIYTAGVVGSRPAGPTSTCPDQRLRPGAECPSFLSEMSPGAHQRSYWGIGRHSRGAWLRNRGRASPSRS